MKRIGKAPNIAIAALWADMLCQLGIRASVQRFYMSSVAGEIPPDQALPEIWVDDDAQSERARDVLRELEHTKQRRWSCPCGEQVEGGFDSCWQCGRVFAFA